MKISALKGKSISDMGILAEYKYMLKKDVAFINDECEKLGVEQETDTEKYKEIIRKFPKCAVRSAAQECNCEFNCIKTLFKDIEWSGECKLYDFDDIFNIKKYKNCNGATHRPKANVLVNYKFGENILEAKKMFNLYFEGLCNDTEIFDKLKCATLELRDECFNDNVCTRSALPNKTISSCYNPSYTSQLINIYELLFDLPEVSYEDHFEMPGQRIFKYRQENEGMNHGRSLKQYDDQNRISYQSTSLKGEEFLLCKPELFIVFGMYCVAYFLHRNCKDMKFYKKLGIVLTSSLLGYLIFLITH